MEPIIIDQRSAESLDSATDFQAMTSFDELDSPNYKYQESEDVTSITNPITDFQSAKPKGFVKYILRKYDPVKEAVYGKRYRETHKEQIKERTKLYREKNREKINERTREKRRLYKVEHSKEHKEKIVKEYQKRKDKKYKQRLGYCEPCDQECKNIYNHNKTKKHLKNQEIFDLKNRLNKTVTE